MELTGFICQSCGMPMQAEEQFGTDSHMNKTEEYCCYCYEGGEFKQPNLTVEEMIEGCVPFMVEEGFDEKTARNMLHSSLPHLKRWAAQPAQ